MVNSLFKHYVGHCPLSVVYLIDTIFRKLGFQVIDHSNTVNFLLFYIIGDGWDQTLEQ
jgi:hypothetical protein